MVRFLRPPITHLNFTRGGAFKPMITSNNNVTFDGVTIARFVNPNTRVVPTIYPATEQVYCLLQVVEPTAALRVVGDYTVLLDKTTVDGYSGTGTGDYLKFYNAVEQAVAAYLLVLNPSVTFTIV